MPFKSLGAVSYLPSIVTMALSCIVCEIQRRLVENHKIFIPHLYLAPLQGVTLSEFCENFDAGKTRMTVLPYGEKL